MARIAGVDLPREKRVEIGLTYIYGIGRTSASKILAATGVNPCVSALTTTILWKVTCAVKTGSTSSA